VEKWAVSLTAISSLFSQISGQFWTIDWTSTYKTGGAKCQFCEYPELCPAAYRTEPPPDDDDIIGGATGINSRVMLFVSFVAAGFVAIAL
jgi:hypothetical protein